MTTTTFNKDRRSVETIIDAGDGIQVSITTSHSKERKTYHTSIYRQRVQDGFVRFAVYEDSLGAVQLPVARYGAKSIRERHAEMLAEHVFGQEADLKAWAREIKTAAV